MTKHCKNSETSYESIRSYVFGFHERVLEEAWSENKGFCQEWIDMQNNWTRLCHLLVSEDQERLSCRITSQRFLELFRSFSWHMTAVFCGAYESAIRELRFILEDMCQAVYLDQFYKDLDLEERYEKAKNHLRGTPLICKLELPSNIEKQLMELYRNLCDYVHPSYKLLMEFFEDTRVVFSYKKERFVSAQSLHRQTCDAIFYLVLRAFPEIGPTFFRKPDVVSSLGAMSCSLTLSLV